MMVASKNTTNHELCWDTLDHRGDELGLDSQLGNSEDHFHFVLSAGRKLRCKPKYIAGLCTDHLLPLVSPKSESDCVPYFH